MLILIFQYFPVEAITSVKLGSQSQVFLASLSDSSIQLVDGPSGKILNTFRGHQQEKYHVESVFSADESFVVSGSEDSKIYMWDLVSGKIVSSLSNHTGPVVSLSMHPKKNSVLLSASADGTIKLWN